MVVLVKRLMSSKRMPVVTETLHPDPITGRQIHRYSVGERECPKVFLSSASSKRYAGYLLIEADLRDAQNWLSEAYKLLLTVTPRSAKKPPSAGEERRHLVPASKQFQAIKAFWFGALVLYGKCFTQAGGRGVKLERSNLPEEFRECHDYVMGLRHTIVAHAGYSSEELAKIVLVLHPKRKDGAYWVRYEMDRIHFKDDRRDALNFEHILRVALQHVTEKMNKLKAHILEKDVLKHPPEYWYSKAK